MNEDLNVYYEGKRENKEAKYRNKDRKNGVVRKKWQGKRRKKTDTKKRKRKKERKEDRKK